MRQKAQHEQALASANQAKALAAALNLNAKRLQMQAAAAANVAASGPLLLMGTGAMQARAARPATPRRVASTNVACCG